ncbi:MAG: helix-turn-helix transcriptional regulator, partial [Clostridiaceae bacterium]|nr:helix-turn-helix transcriptional regulator [Clostridiaceae bacterium]
MDNRLLKTAEVFGRNLLLQRKNKGLTQLQLSKELGVHETTISNWENGLREPNLNTLMIVSQYF